MVKNLLKKVPGLTSIYVQYLNLKNAEMRKRKKVAKWTQKSIGFLRDNGLNNISISTDGQICVKSNYGAILHYIPELLGGILDIEFAGVWEKHETDLILSLLHDDATFIDVGANFGWYSLVTALKYPKLSVHSFEPVPTTYRYFCDNIALNGVTNIVANNMGLGNVNQPLRFTNYKHTGNHITEDMNDTNVDIVPCVRFDDYVDSNKLERIDFIKCDVEGAELFFLQGAEKTLSKHKPKLLLEIEERWTQRYNYHAIDIIKFLTNIGYSYKIITDHGLEDQNCNIDSELSEGRDFLFYA
jgi:FkbM family methyltransferase